MTFRIVSRGILVVAGLLLAACGGRSVSVGEVAVFDLGGMPAIRAATALPVREVEVAAPSWLATSAMQYRLAYADGARRHAYSESRWAAAPAELVEAYLRRGMAADGTAASKGCVVRFELDEFSQVFDRSDDSRAVIEGRLSLLAAQGNAVLARQRVSLSQRSGSADARGGVAAHVQLAQRLTGDVQQWLAALAGQAPRLIERCQHGVAPF